MLRIEALCKHYRIAGVKKRVLDGVSLTVHAGRIVSLTGPSGCGKTTLLNAVAGLVAPDAGKVYIGGRRMIYGLDLLASRRRNREIGFIFQTFRLMNDLSVLENVLLPARLRGRVGKEVKRRAEALLERLGIAAFRNTKAALLSGGQKQRVAIARALINEPPLILADEPTANLDRHTARGIFDILRGLRKEGKAVLMVTHDGLMQRTSDELYEMADGRLTTQR